MELAAFWFRRDLRLIDNVGLGHALKSGLKVLPVFIFDNAILDELPRDDARVSFIYQQLSAIHEELQKLGSALCVRIGNPLEIWQELIREFPVRAIYTNEDYEPYARERDGSITQLAKSNGLEWHVFKDQVIFDPDEVMKPADGKPYTVFTPYKNRWLERLRNSPLPDLYEINTSGFYKIKSEFPSLEAIGFTKSSIEVRPYSLQQLTSYQQNRDFPDKDATSYLSVHLRFGTVSIRQILNEQKSYDQTFLSELIWREFFMQILFHFPQVVKHSFKPKYDAIPWRNNEQEFEKWKNGTTGYPLVDAGMRQLNQTGYMHNRVRMVVASFLCKHLLIDWRWGEAYFAQKLLDFELSSNNGNWQWSAGCGCDAAPYFRVFNPTEQLKKFDPNMNYVKQWVDAFVPPMVDHKQARNRAIITYKKVLNPA